MKQFCEYVRGLRYKLRMMGILVDPPTYIFGDNQSVLVNTSKPHSTLKKKSASIAFHYFKEGNSKDEWKTSYINMYLNPADMLTKSLPGGQRRSNFLFFLLHYIEWYTSWQWITPKKPSHCNHTLAGLLPFQQEFLSSAIQITIKFSSRGHLGLYLTGLSVLGHLDLSFTWTTNCIYS